MNKKQILQRLLEEKHITFDEMWILMQDESVNTNLTPQPFPQPFSPTVPIQPYPSFPDQKPYWYTTPPYTVGDIFPNSPNISFHTNAITGGACFNERMFNTDKATMSI